MILFWILWKKFKRQWPAIKIFLFDASP